MNARSLPILLAAVLALLGLGAVYFLLRPGEPRPVVLDPGQEEQPHAGVPPAGTSVTETGPTPGAPREKAEGVHIPIEDEPATPGQALAIHVHGRALDGDGRAVRDAQFTILQYEYRGAGPDTGEEKRLSVQCGGEDQTTRSDAQGRFELDLGVRTHERGVAHTLAFRLVAKGWADLDEAREGYSGETLDLGDLVLARGVELRGFVRDEDGRRIEGAEVSVSRRKGEGWEGRVLARSDSDGSFTVAAAPEGEVSVFARTDALAGVAMVRLVLDAARPPAPIELVLRSKQDPGEISGVVLDPEGKPVPFAQVQVRHQGNPDAGMLMTNAGEQGQFRTAAEPDVLYSFFVRDPAQRYAPCMREGVRAGTHDLQLKLDKGTRFTLLVRDERAVSVESFAHLLLRDDERAQAWQFKEARHAGGRLELVAFPGEFFLEVRASGFADARLGPLVATKLTSELVVELVHLPGLSGTVRSKDGALAGARVAVLEGQQHGNEVSIGGFRSLVGAGELASSRSDEQGQFSIALSRSGQVYLRAELSGFATQLFGPLEFDARIGASKLVLELSRGCVLEVHVRTESGALLAGRIVGISNASGRPRSARTDEQGLARFENLASGGWQVKLLEREDKLDEFSLRVGREGAARPITSDCEVAEGRTTRHEIVLANPAVLTLQFQPGTGAGVVWRVCACRLEGEDGEEGERVYASGPDASGNWTLELAQSGRHRLFVVTDGDPAEAAPFQAWEEFVVPAGASVHAFELTLGSITGTLHAPFEKDERVLFDWSDGAGRAARSGVPASESGSFRFPLAPVGKCKVRRVGPSAVTREIDVRAGESSTLGEL